MCEARPLTAADIDACMKLSTEANWNQESADWRLILSIGEGRGIFRDGRLVASAGVVTYDKRFGWICMVLVTADERGKGHATEVMRWAIERLEGLGMIPGLDATPAGREVYRKLGFTDIYTLSRLERAGEGVAACAADSAQVRPMIAQDLAAVASFDKPAFGAARDKLIAALAARKPEIALLSERDGTIAGYALGRGGRSAVQIGPVVASDETTAIALIDRALARLSGPVFIDVADHHAALKKWLTSRGFQQQRTFTRMLKDRNSPLDDMARVFAITGPEFG